MLALILVMVGSLYLFTLDTGLRPDELTGGDLITHQYAQVQARFSNAPGYPLYTMLGWLWFRVGRILFNWVLNPVQILSFYSTIWGLLSLWVLYHSLSRPEVGLDHELLPALLTLFYATTYFFWYYSVTTEQYTSAILQTLLLIYLAFFWEAKPTHKTLWLMAFISGTMLANMLTTLFILPPLLYLIFTKRPAIFKDWKLIGQTVLIGLLPLLSYGYVFVRGAQHPEWRGAGDWASTTDWFVQFVSTQQGRDELAPGLSLQNLFTAEFPALMWQELTWPVLVGGLIGLALMGRRLAIFFYGTLIIYACFVTAYRFGNWFQVILPAYPIFVLGFGRLIGLLWQRFPRPELRIALVAGLILLLAYRFSLSLPRANQRHLVTDTGLEPGWAILNDVTEPGWTLSATFEEWVALQYLMEVWQAEPAIELVAPAEPAPFLTRKATETYPNLITLSPTYPQAIGGELIYLSPSPLPISDAPPDMLAISYDFADQMRLMGYNFDSDRSLVILYWTPLTAMSTDYTISVRLWQNGGPIQTATGPLQQDHQPVWHTYPTSRWQREALVVDAYTFDVPVGTHPEQMHLVVYQQTKTGFENLGDLLLDLKR